MIATALTLEAAHVQGYALVRNHTERFLDYIGSLTEDEISTPVPGLDWTVGETVAHVQSVYLRYTVDRRRASGPREIATVNAADIERLGVDIAAAGRSIREQLELMAAAPAKITPDQQFPFHAGQTITIAGGWGNLLGELHAHGDDIARATGRPFGVPGEDLEITYRFTFPLLRAWMRADAAAERDTWRLRLPFGAIDLAFEVGDLRWGEPVAGEPDHVITVEDPADFMLAFPYRRREIADPEVAELASRFHTV